jgi:pimeloyl-ACP methyl ester carboxylesterase
LRHYSDQNTQIAYKVLGQEKGPVTVWAHGWGQDHSSFLPFAQSLEKQGHHILVDFPGFGKSPPPAGIWGTEQYADAMANFIRQGTIGPVIWVGHSFGCRVGVRLAAKYPELVAGLFLIAAAGIPRKRSLHKKLYLKARIALFKFMKKLIPYGLNEDKLYKIFGSSDYRNAGPLRQLFVKVVNEDLGNLAIKIKCPVVLAYGTMDTETPLEIGQRYHRLIKGSEMLRFEGLDHYTILTSGRHQVAPYLKRFIKANGHV